MLDPLDRHSRDSTLFQFTTKRMRDFIDPKHLLIHIDEQFDFQKLVEPLEDYYCRDNGRPAIHPEVLVRALLISSLYNVSSFRRLCAAIGDEQLARIECAIVPRGCGSGSGLTEPPLFQQVAKTVPSATFR